LIHFDFDDRYEDEATVGSAISRREGFILSVVVHALVAAGLALAPELPIFQQRPDEQELMRARQPEEERTFVFVQPRIDLEAMRPPPQAPLSDLDRQAQAPERAEQPDNPLPLALGDSAERTEAVETERARGEESEQPAPPQPQLESQIARTLPPADAGLPRLPESRRPTPTGALGEALRNLERYVQRETFNNPQGGQDSPGASIQFDTKGVEFGPWLRRFVAQVRRNWFIPMAAYTMRGHVVLQFNIHKNGSITDVAVVQPSGIESFNIAAYNAIIASNPVDPLPPEYPADRAFFTVTFYYNEQP
jgi:TonB family protein